MPKEEDECPLNNELNANNSLESTSDIKLSDNLDGFQ